MASSAHDRVEEVSFLELRDRAGIDRRRIPIEGTVETTYRCNLNCVHCYVNQPAGSAEERERELSLPRLKQLVDEIVAEGTLFVLFTGGEVLVRQDFPELYLYARSKGLLVTIFTNGTLVTDRIADFLAEHPPDKIEISLYGMTRETYGYSPTPGNDSIFRHVPPPSSLIWMAPSSVPTSSRPSLSGDSSTHTMFP